MNAILCRTLSSFPYCRSIIAANEWLKYGRYDVKHQIINRLDTSSSTQITDPESAYIAKNRTIWPWLARVTIHYTNCHFILFISLGFFLKIEITSTLTVNNHSSEYMDDDEVYVSTQIILVH